jgi:hypothetical protein
LRSSVRRELDDALGLSAIAREVLADTREKDSVSRIYVRADAGFASSDVYEHLEAERIKSANQAPASRVLQERIGPMLYTLAKLS